MERFFILEDNKVYGIYVTDSYFIKVDLHFYYSCFSSPPKLSKLSTNKAIVPRRKLLSFALICVACFGV